jgi:hypothetical protein
LNDKNLKISLFPNPNNGSMQVSYDLEKKQKAIFIIYDMLGRKEAECQLPKESKTLYINEPTLKSGIYFYKVIVDDKIVRSDKLVIIREE